MKTKIGTSFGLALLLAMGVIATMLALGMFSASKAHADINILDITLSKAGAGSNAQITLTFTHDAVLPAGSGQIVVTFDKTWGIPSTISKDHIALTTQQTTGGTSNPAIDPTVVAGSNSTVVTITIGDTNPSTTGVQNMMPQATGVSTPHILVFSPLAGITNPTTQATQLTSWIVVTTTADTTPTDGPVPTTGSLVTSSYSTWAGVSNRAVSLSPTSGPNGTSVTATGKGYTAGTLTAFLDLGTANEFEPGTDVDLGTATIASGTAAVTFTANLPTFSAGANSINMRDGTGVVDASSATFTITGVVTTSKASVTRGESVTVKLRQFTAGDVVSISFGGAGATLPSDVTIPASGSLDLAMTVPTTTSLGTQRVSVASTAESTRNVNIEVVGAPVTMSPSTAVPDQKITISASGFTTGGSATIPVGSATCSDAGITISNTCATTTHAATSIDNSGNWVLTYTVPDNSTTRVAGAYTVVATDSSSKTGQATLTIPSRSLTLDIASSRRGSTVTFSGGGMPAKASVGVTYTVSTTSSPSVATVTADSEGNFSGSFLVPTTANIPSSNTVTATATGTSATAVTATATHAVPGATITVTETTSSSGSSVTVSGTGFPGFATMTDLTIGGVGAIPTPAPSTDTDGVFTVSVLVPQLALGTQAIIGTIGGVSANTSITLETAVVVVEPTVQTTEAVFADAIAAENLVRVWLRQRHQGMVLLRSGF